jgi:CHAT domain-containing protein
MDWDGDGAVVVRVRIEGWGTSTGAVKVFKKIPARWVLRIVRADVGWGIESAHTIEEEIAAEVMAAADDAQRVAILDRESDIDRGQVLGIVADLATDTTGERETSIIAFALEESRRLRDPLIESIVLRMKSVQQFSEAPDEALITARQALDIAIENRNPDHIASSTFSVGIAEWVSGDIEAGIADLGRSADMIDQVTDPRRALPSRMMQHWLLGSTGRASEALSVALTARRDAERYAWLEGELGAITAIDSSLNSMGREASDTENVRRAYGLARRLRVVSIIGQMTANYAAQVRLLGDPDRAIALYREVLAVQGQNGETRAGLRTGLSIALADAGAYEEAYAEAKTANAEQHRNGRVHLDVLVNLSNAARASGRFDEALRVAELAYHPPDLSVAERDTAFEAVNARAHALLALGRCDEAAETFRDAIAVAEAERVKTGGANEARIDFFLERREPFRALMTMLLDEHRNAEALQIAEMLKARALRDALDGGRIVHDADPVLATRERELEAEIVRLNLVNVRRSSDPRSQADVQAALADARLQLDTLRIIAGTTSPMRSDDDALARPRTLLPTENDVILEYVVGDDATTLFTIGRNADALQVDVYLIAGTRRELEAEVSAFGTMLETRDFDYADAARALYDKLLAPVATTIAGRRAVAIIPDGVLWRLPFAVLRDRRNRHLVETTTLFYAPSLAWLEAMSARPDDAPNRALVVGDPAVSSQQAALVRSFTRDIGPLPDAARESRYVAALYPASRVLLGANATESAVKDAAPKYGVLHFATHALTDTQQPLYSSIVLARGTEGGAEDGLLEAREVADLRLNADLVVLSACNTGRGVVHEGEGLVGLPWAFFLAGATRTVVAQWQIDSKATAEIMMAFHRDLKERGGPAAAAESLRHAQLAMMRVSSNAHPYYWGSFAVIGAGWSRSASTAAASSR